MCYAPRRKASAALDAVAGNASTRPRALLFLSVPFALLYIHPPIEFSFITAHKPGGRTVRRTLIHPSTKLDTSTLNALTRLPAPALHHRITRAPGTRTIRPRAGDDHWQRVSRFYPLAPRRPLALAYHHPLAFTSEDSLDARGPLSLKPYVQPNSEPSTAQRQIRDTDAPGSIMGLPSRIAPTLTESKIVPRRLSLSVFVGRARNHVASYFVLGLKRTGCTVYICLVDLNGRGTPSLPGCCAHPRATSSSPASTRANLLRLAVLACVPSTSLQDPTRHGEGYIGEITGTRSDPHHVAARRLPVIYLTRTSYTDGAPCLWSSSRPRVDDDEARAASESVLYGRYGGRRLLSRIATSVDGALHPSPVLSAGVHHLRLPASPLACPTDPGRCQRKPPHSTLPPVRLLEEWSFTICKLSCLDTKRRFCDSSCAYSPSGPSRWASTPALGSEWSFCGSLEGSARRATVEDGPSAPARLGASKRTPSAPFPSHPPHPALCL
ncbi:hypothetical protein C8R45DRAFT_1104193 [Mycena sanguinolenta]|nr:hypothetical protein C8R45DRAFT_1104193 [Mycena sanguinolenta]